MSTQNWSEDPLLTSRPGEETTSTSGQSTPTAAKDEAKDVGREGVNAAKNVASTAGAEAKNVAQEAGTQAKNLIGELGSDLKSQANTQQQRVSEGLRSLSDELRSMADKSEGGTAQHLVQQVADRTGGAASWLEGRDPGSLLDEVTGFARRKPGAFLLVAAGAGLLAGRLARGLQGGGSGSDGDATTAGNGSSGTTTGVPGTIYPPVPDEYGTGAPAYDADIEIGTPPVTPPATTAPPAVNPVNPVNPTDPFAEPGLPSTEPRRDFQ